LEGNDVQPDRLIRQTKLEEVWQEFQQVQAQIENEAESNDEKEHEQYRIDFKELYYVAIAEANEKSKRSKLVDKELLDQMFSPAKGNELNDYGRVLEHVRWPSNDRKF